MGPKFSERWLEKKDDNGTLIGKWLEKIDARSAKCLVDDSILKTLGIDKIKQHANTTIHKKNLFKLDAKQMLLMKMKPTQDASEPQITVPSNKEVTNDNAVNFLTLFNRKESATRAELLYCLDLIQTKSSFNSSLHKKGLFNMMFPGVVPEAFSISPMKVSYLVTDALGPYFKDVLLKEMHAGEVYFTLQFDETTNVKSKKELQIRIQFWSEKLNRVINRFLTTYFIEKGNAEVIYKYLLKALDENILKLSNVLTLGIDGPNVNKSVFKKCDTQLENENQKNLINIGSCTLHMASNSFHAGLEKFCIDVDDFIIKIYYFFRHQSNRCANYEEIQIQCKVPLHKFQKHIKTRWLTLGPSAKRILEQLPALKKYFLKFISKEEPATVKKQKYIDICKYLNNPLLECTLEFSSFIAEIFTNNFTLYMQKDEPLIHLVYDQLKIIVMIFVKNILHEKTDNFCLDSSMFDDDKIEDLLKRKDLKRMIIDCGGNTNKLMKQLKESDLQIFLKEAREFYETTINFIINRIPKVRVLKNFKCLSPHNIKNTESVKYIQNIAKKLPVAGINVDVLGIEWNMLQLDDDAHFILKKGERIDEYWRHIFDLKINSDTRYPQITKIVKASLSLVHGSAQVERGFSESSLQLTDDRSNMNLRTLNARLMIQDALGEYENIPYKVPITNDLIKKAQCASKTYRSYLEEEHKISEAKKQAEELEIERKNKEKKILENYNLEIKSLKLLEKELLDAKRMYEEGALNTETMQKHLSETCNKKNKKIDQQIIQQLVCCIDKLRHKEKKLKGTVDKLQKLIDDKKAQVIKNKIKLK